MHGWRLYCGHVRRVDHCAVADPGQGAVPVYGEGARCPVAGRRAEEQVFVWCDGIELVRAWCDSTEQVFMWSDKYSFKSLSYIKIKSIILTNKNILNQKLKY